MSFDLITVHAKEDNKEIMINIHYIAFLLPEDDGTTVEMIQGSTLWIKETREELDKTFGIMEGLWRQP